MSVSEQSRPALRTEVRETSVREELPSANRPMSKLGRYRWVICALLFFACVINYMDRQILGLLKPDLMRILGWTEKDYGLIAICFQASYAVGQTAFGPIITHIGTKATYAFSMI